MMTDARVVFQRRLEVTRRGVQAELLRALRAEQKRVGRYGKRPQSIAGAGAAITLRGGKRFRAALCMSVALDRRPSNVASLRGAMQVSAALELFHAYLLVQDDWMDGDLARRGGPSAHAMLRRGRRSAHAAASSAILASDLLWNLALAQLLAIDIEPERTRAMLRELTSVHRKVVVGQELDLASLPSLAAQVADLKTGSYTVEGPLVLGALFAGLPAASVAALRRFARPLGIAFQHRDDLLSVFGKTSETGKSSGGDIREGRRSALLDEAFRRVRGDDRRTLVSAFGNARASAAMLRGATEVIERSGARAAVQAAMVRYCGRAARLARGLPVSERARIELEGAAWLVAAS